MEKDFVLSVIDGNIFYFSMFEIAQIQLYS